MDSLARFWGRLEHAPGVPAPLDEWRVVCGDHFGMVRHLLVREGRLAPTLPSHLPNAPRMRVSQVGSAHVATCPEGVTPSRRLSSEEIVLWKIDPRLFRAAVCAALGLETSTTPMPRLPGLHQLGTWGQQATRRYPVLLVAHGHLTVFAELVREASDAQPEGGIILTPTDGGWTDQLRSRAEGRRCILVPLTDVIEDHEGRLSEAPLWTNFTQRFVGIAGVSTRALPRPRRPSPKSGPVLDRIEKYKECVTELARARFAELREVADAGHSDPTIEKVTLTQIAEEIGCKKTNLSQMFRHPKGKGLKDEFLRLNNPQALLAYGQKRDW